MNKTISINLSGQVFQIDEQAYDKLKNYLDSIRRRFSGSDGGQEIIADIEARIGEMFSEKLNDRKQVITLNDVGDMMRHMGRPEEFETAGETGEPVQGQSKGSRRLFRDPDDKIVAGVCSGLSAYLGITDPLWFRLTFVFALIFGFGSPILIYIILWLIVPEAKNASEKLQMKGEHITISNIEKTIKDDLGDLKDRINNISAQEGTHRAKNFLGRIIGLLIGIVAFVIKVVLKLVALALIVAGLAIMVSLVLAATFPAYVDGFSLPLLYPLFFESQMLVFLGLLGIVLLAGIPALSIALLGFHLLLNNKRRVKGLGISMLGLWLLGLGLVIFTAAKTASDFRMSEILRADIPIIQSASDTLFLETLDVPLPENAEEYSFFDLGRFIPGESEYYVSGRVKLDIKKSPSPDYQLTQVIKSNGRNRRIANDKANAVEYKIFQNDSTLSLAQVLSFPVAHHFRGQEVLLTLKVPEGKSVFLSESVSDILYDVQNVTDTYDRDMVGHVWTMLPAGLTCADCDYAAMQEHDMAFPKGRARREFNHSDFSAIEAAGAFNIEIKQGDDFTVAADGGQRFVDNIEVTQSGSRLKIDIRHFNVFSRDGKGTVVVTLPELSGLKIAGANHAVVAGFKGNRLDLEVLGASEVEVKSSFTRIEAEIEGASTVKLMGEGREMTAEVNGASKLKAFDFETSQCEIEVNGASKAEINVTDNLKAEASGASEILYKGLPKISSDVTGFSSMKPSK